MLRIEKMLRGDPTLTLYAMPSFSLNNSKLRQQTSVETENTCEVALTLNAAELKTKLVTATEDTVI